jgi:hypothetical protein
MIVLFSSELLSKDCSFQPSVAFKGLLLSAECCFKGLFQQGVTFIGLFLSASVDFKENDAFRDLCCRESCAFKGVLLSRKSGKVVKATHPLSDKGYF